MSYPTQLFTEKKLTELPLTIAVGINVQKSSGAVLKSLDYSFLHLITSTEVETLITINQIANTHSEMLHQQTLRLCVQLFPLTLLTGTSTRCLPAELRAGKADLSAPELFREGDLSVRHTLTLNSSLGSLLLQISRWKVRRELSSQADKINTICSDVTLNYAASP